MRPSLDISEDERGLLSNLTKEDVDPKGSNRRDNSKTWLACAICLLIGIALGTYFNNITASPAKECKSESAKAGMPPKTKGSGEIDMHSMDFPLDIPITFQPNDYFANTSDPDIDSSWAQLLPQGRGFIRVDANGKPVHYYYSDEPEDLSSTRVISVFHQLHCLNTLRKAVNAATTNPDAFYYITPQLSSHWATCFDYLRQVLMCNSDITQESLKKSKDGDADGTVLTTVDGWGTTRQCRNFGDVHKWTEMHRATDEAVGE